MLKKLVNKAQNDPILHHRRSIILRLRPVIHKEQRTHLHKQRLIIQLRVKFRIIQNPTDLRLRRIRESNASLKPNNKIISSSKDNKSLKNMYKKHYN